ncbi:hypothetical protein [Streptosporangium sp. KLBMP 9127]|nr:hypothetical protein [Streptosporangium sp. KLBMP 9127]
MITRVITGPLDVLTFTHTVLHAQCRPSGGRCRLGMIGCGPWPVQLTIKPLQPRDTAPAVCEAKSSLSSMVLDACALHGSPPPGGRRAAPAGEHDAPVKTAA